MQTDLMRLGICENDACLAAGSGPVELYDGPGRYCPDCGDVLQQFVPGKSASSLPKSPAPLTKPREGPLAPFSFRSHPLALSAALVVAAGAIAVLWTMAGGHSRLPGSVGVYVSSMMARIARADLHEYAARAVPSPRPITDIAPVARADRHEYAVRAVPSPRPITDIAPVARADLHEYAVRAVPSPSPITDIAPVARADRHEYAARAVPSPRPITDAQFEKLLADLDAKGTTTQLSPLITSRFGITHQGQTLTVHQDSFADEAKNVHGLVKLGNGNYLFGYLQMYASHLYYVDKHLVLIAAMVDSFRDGGEKISMLPNKDAQKGLDAELTFFAQLAACPDFDCP
jgi:hypothetical protein